jgi:hypothetical protein
MSICLHQKRAACGETGNAQGFTNFRLFEGPLSWILEARDWVNHEMYLFRYQGLQHYLMYNHVHSI